MILPQTIRLSPSRSSDSCFSQVAHPIGGRWICTCFGTNKSSFYVGQSYVAFERVWEHLRNGYKGRSMIGRFILCNWPASLKFVIELMISQSARFASVGHDMDAAERLLIQNLSPCFSETLNSRPTPLPSHYALPNTKPICSPSLNKLIRQAERTVHADEKRLWLGDDK